MNLTQVRSVVVAMALLSTLVSGPAPHTVRAATTCAPPDSYLVTVLARPGWFRHFARVGSEQFAPFLDPQTEQTMVPVRSFVESLSPGGTEWNGSTRTATFQRKGHRIAFTIPAGSNVVESAMVDGENRSVQAFLCGGRLWAPARFIANGFGVEIRWYYDRTAIADPAWTEKKEEANGGW